MTPQQTAYLRDLASVMVIQSARDILAHISSHRMVEMSSTVVHTKPVLQQQRELMAVANIRQLLLLVTGSNFDPVARIRALAAKGGIVAIITAVQAGKQANPDAAAEIDRIAKILDLLYAEHEREGGEWPIPEHFGQPQYTTTAITRVPASTHWHHHFPGTNLPTEDEIDFALTLPPET